MWPTYTSAPVGRQSRELVRVDIVLYCACVRVVASTLAVMRQLSGGTGEGRGITSPEIMSSSSASGCETTSPLRRRWNSVTLHKVYNKRTTGTYCHLLLLSLTAIRDSPALIKAAQNVGSIPTTLFTLSACNRADTFSSRLLRPFTSSARVGESSLRFTRCGTTLSAGISSSM